MSRDRRNRVTVQLRHDETWRGGYSAAVKLLQRPLRYDVFWQAEGDRDGMNSGSVYGITPEAAVERIEGLASYGDFIDITATSQKLSGIRVDHGVAIAHADKRRVIFDPERITEGLRGDWYHHNHIAIINPRLVLG
ncbi:hypothetical protein KY335_05915, partial [Candidatus Woesearchaeota archaeon]|nr:hypothetical protein [Candidatus Woesearchaeota archaeon]